MSTPAPCNPRQPDSSRRRAGFWPTKKQPRPAQGAKPARPAAQGPTEPRRRRVPRLSPEQLRDAFDWDDGDEPQPDERDFYIEPDEPEY